MTAEELLARFPTIQEAVAWSEMFVFSDAGVWELTQRRVEGGASLAAIVEDFVAVIDESLNEYDPPNRMQLLKAKEQMALPEFARYLTARLGLL